MFPIKYRVSSVPLFTLQTEGRNIKFNSRRQLAQVALFSLLALGAGSAFAQTAAGEGRGGGCPNPISETINVGQPNVGAFRADQLALPRAWLNDSAANKAFLGTFQWKPKSKCCEITRATLTVNMKANTASTSATASDAGNDTIGVMVGGVGAMPQPGGQVYTPTFAFPAGTLITKTFNITGTALANLETGGGLSFVVQDDTMVMSATLTLSDCCLSR